MLKSATWTLGILIAEASAVVWVFGWPWWLVPLYLVGLWTGVLATWIVYLGSMQLIRDRELGTLTLPAKVLGAPLVIVSFIVLDIVVCNILIGHAMFLGITHLPLTSTVSDFKWHRHDAPIRQEAARFICLHFLDRFDLRPDGKGHCRP